MSLYYRVALLGMLAVSAQGAVITSGTITATRFSQSETFVYSFLLSDGITVSGGSSTDGPTFPSCVDSGQFCTFSGPRFIDIGVSTLPPYGIISGLLFASYTGSYTAVRGVYSQSYTLPFAVTGSVSDLFGPGSQTPCPFPEGGPQSACMVPLTGGGTAAITLGGFPNVNFGIETQFISSATYTFTQVPEPASIVMLGIFALPLTLKRWRRRIRAGRQ